MGCVTGAEEDAQDRDDRIESYYQESARDLAEWLVDAEDMSRECDEGDRSERYRSAWISARSRAKWARWAQDSNLRFTRNMWGDALRDLARYRLAWLSARRRAARESEYAAEALTLKDAAISVVRAELDGVRKSTCAPAI